MDVKETLDRLTPETERLPHWDAVLRDARPSRARWAAPRLAVLGVAVGLASLLAVAPWRGGESAGVLDRALAAVGDGPVLHLVLRNEWGGTLVDLKTGERKPLYNERELWIDPERGMAGASRFGGTEQERYVSPPSMIERPFAVVASDYRDALESGRAKVSGSGVVDGIPVYWIRVVHERLPDVGDGRLHDWAVEVAVSKVDYKPVYIRETRDGEQAELTGSRVLVAEQLPAGSGDFSPTPRGPGRPMMFGVSPAPISHEAAQATLDGRAAWLGPTFMGLPLAKVSALTLGAGGKVEKGIQLTYGPSADQNEPDGRRPFLTIEQAPRPHPVLERGIGKYDVPEGHVVLTPGGHAHRHYRGTYVAIYGRNEAQALAAARALTPLSAGSGAGG